MKPTRIVKSFMIDLDLWNRFKSSCANRNISMSDRIATLIEKDLRRKAK